MYRHLVPGIVLGIMDAASPAAALLHLGNRDFWSVKTFNKGERSSVHTYHHPPNAHDAAQKVLTDKMGVTEMDTRYGFGRGRIKVGKGDDPQKCFDLEGAIDVESLAEIVGGGPTAVTEITYASVLLAHHIDAFLGSMEPKDRIYVEAVAGRQKPSSHFFVVEKQKPTTTRQTKVLYENFDVLVAARSMYPLVCRDLDLEPKKNRFRDYRRDNGEAMLFQALAEDQGLTGPNPWKVEEPFNEYLEKDRARRAVAANLREEVVPKLRSVRIVFANSQDSVPESKRPEK